VLFVCRLVFVLHWMTRALWLLILRDNSESERVCKEVVVAHFKIWNQDLSGRTEEKHERTSEQWVYGPVFEPDPPISHIRRDVLLGLVQL
jgi:hypothetical protein